MGQTSKYGFLQWEGWGWPGRESANEMLAQLDGILAQKTDESRTEALEQVVAEKCRLVVGAYTGNGALSQAIALGFQPTAVLVENQSGMRYSGPNGFCGGMAAPGLGGGLEGKEAALLVTQSGFTVYESNDDALRHMNVSGRRCYYIAFQG